MLQMLESRTSSIVTESSAMGLLALAVLPFVLALGWLALARLVPLVCSYPTNKRICLLLAHCDDEAMFFAPTVIRLANPALNNTVEILCLSNGQDPALRATRRCELLRSASNLGLDSPAHVTCLDDEDSFPDSMTISWSSEKVAAALTDKYPETETRPDIIITFDEHGISSHANHISCLAGAKHWLSSGPSNMRATTALYSLTTTNILRKYSGVLDAPFSLLLYLVGSWKGNRGRGKDDPPRRLLFLSGFASYRRAQRSMTTCHESQMLWFRYGWIWLSRYISTNDLMMVEA